MERLQKFIAESGYTSRRKAEDLIVNGKVKVNGEVVTKLGIKINDNDKVIINGIELNKEKKEYYIFNKPRGVITTTSDDKGRKTVMDYFNSNKRLYPVGRLDYDTTGLLLITNDGNLANALMHPSYKINKVYIAKINGIIDGYTIKKLKEGVEIDGIKVYPSRVKLKSKNAKTKTSIVEITIHEGKNHQVKRMFEAVGYQVLKLKREKYGPFTLEGIGFGQYRFLTINEINKLKKLINKND